MRIVTYELIVKNEELDDVTTLARGGKQILTYCYVNRWFSVQEVQYFVYQKLQELSYFAKFHICIALMVFVLFLVQSDCQNTFGLTNWYALYGPDSIRKNLMKILTKVKFFLNFLL